MYNDSTNAIQTVDLCIGHGTASEDFIADSGYSINLLLSNNTLQMGTVDDQI